MLDHWRQRANEGLSPLIWSSSCEVLDGGELCLDTIRGQRRGESPSLSKTESSESEPKKMSSDEDSGEEDFAKELQDIADDDSEHGSETHYSLTLSPLHHPTQRRSGQAVISPSGLCENPSPRSCKLGIAINVSNYTYGTYSRSIA